MNNEETTLRQRLTIRVGQQTLSFSMGRAATENGSVTYEPYTVKSGISMAANLREALKTAALPAEGFTRAMVMIDAPVMMVPVDLFVEDETEELYNSTFSRKKDSVIMHNVLPELNAVAVFAVNKDLKMVIDDHFHDATFISAMSPVWRHLHRRSFVGNRNKLYGYFHDGRVDIFSFTQHRFKFYNTFETSKAEDALYFLLCVWKQLNLQPEHDEMHIVGEIPEGEMLLDELKNYVRRAYVISPESDYNNAPATKVKGLPYDLMTYYVRGR